MERGGGRGVGDESYARATPNPREAHERHWRVVTQRGFKIRLPRGLGKVAWSLELGLLLPKMELKWSLCGENHRAWLESPVQRTWRAIHWCSDDLGRSRVLSTCQCLEPLSLDEKLSVTPSCPGWGVMRPSLP